MVVSPFIYPGGKSRFVRYARAWLKSQPRKPGLLVEPFAGGAHVGLAAAVDGLVEHVLLNELDVRIAAVWETILNGDVEWLINRIENFTLTEEAAVELLFNTQPTTAEELAFYTVINNRASYGGVMYEGERIKLKFIQGRAILGRWCPGSIIKRIRRIVEHRDRITFLYNDAFDVLAQYGDREDAVWFIDPPYLDTGSYMYLHNSVDHDALVRQASGLAGDFLITLDNVEGAHRLAEQNGLDRRAVPVKNTNHAWKTELIIGRNLQWARALEEVK